MSRKVKLLFMSSVQGDETHQTTNAKKEANCECFTPCGTFGATGTICVLAMICSLKGQDAWQEKKSKWLDMPPVGNNYLGNG